MEVLDADMATELGGYSHSQRHLHIACQAMHTLYLTDLSVTLNRVPRNSMPGMCLALTGTGNRQQLCLKPVWEHDGTKRLVCMHHLVHAADAFDGSPHAGPYMLEQATTEHINAYIRHTSGADPLPVLRSFNRHRDTQAFISSMLKQAQSLS
jgi:hypothetical protein